MMKEIVYLWHLKIILVYGEQVFPRKRGQSEKILSSILYFSLSIRTNPPTQLLIFKVIRLEQLFIKKHRSLQNRQTMHWD